MPVLMAKDVLQEQKRYVPAPYPASTKQAAGIVKGVHTEVLTIAFADKIMVTISQGGRLAQWVC